MGDLIQFPDTFTRQNAFEGKRYSYILLLVDCFSKKMWARPLSKKTKEETATALSSIFDSMENPPTMFVTDEGKGNYYFVLFELFVRIFQLCGQTSYGRIQCKTLCDTVKIKL